MMTKNDRIRQADERAQQWLYEANLEIESGREGGKRHQECERKAQYWLDRLNRLTIDRK